MMLLIRLCNAAGDVPASRTYAGTGSRNTKGMRTSCELSSGYCRRLWRRVYEYPAKSDSKKTAGDEDGDVGWVVEDSH